MALLLLIILSGVITVFVLTGYGCSILSWHGRTPADAGVRLRGLACLVGAAAITVYVWGALHVAGAVVEAEDGGTGSVPFPTCVEAGGKDAAAQVDGYRIGYLPVRFVCAIDGGGYTAAVPGYVNPVALGLAAAAFLLSVLAWQHRDPAATGR
ncbi:hypothetical protein GCM10027168_63500 [Streptomyces capparidis]